MFGAPPSSPGLANPPNPPPTGPPAHQPTAGVVLVRGAKGRRNGNGRTSRGEEILPVMRTAQDLVSMARVFSSSKEHIRRPMLPSLESTRQIYASPV